MLKKKWDDRFYYLIGLQYKLAWQDVFTIEEITLLMTPDNESAIHDAIACGDLKVYTCGARTVIFKEDVQAFCKSLNDQWFEHKR